jgi:hypothetical protein
MQNIPHTKKYKVLYLMFGHYRICSLNSSFTPNTGYILQNVQPYLFPSHTLCKRIPNKQYICRSTNHLVSTTHSTTERQSHVPAVITRDLYGFISLRKPALYFTTLGGTIKSKLYIYSYINPQSLPTLKKFLGKVAFLHA